MKGYIQWIGGALLFALIVISYSTCNRYKQQYEEQSSLIESSQDTVKYYKEKDGKQSAQIALLEGSKENLLKVIGKSNQNLAKLIEKGATSGTSFEQTTQFDTVFVIKRDTIDGKIAYTNEIVNQWMRVDVSVADDSLYTNVQFKDSVLVSFQKVKQGFLKPKKSVVIVTNVNPYVKTSGVKAFDIPQKKSRLNFWVNFGLGAGVGYLLFK
jgi:hypothetical protein